MYRFLMAVFWFSNFGGLVQLGFIVSATWLVLSGSHTFSGLSVEVFLVGYVPWLLWVKTLALAMFGELGAWMLSLPILVMAPLKVLAGAVIGFGAYSVASAMPEDQAAYV